MNRKPFSQDPIIPKGLFKPFQIGGGHWDQGQSEFILDFSHKRQGGLYRNGICLVKHGLAQGKKLEVDLPGLIKISFFPGVSISAVSWGTILATTEITPFPPMDNMGRVRLSSPESRVILSPASLIISAICPRSPEASFIATTSGSSAKPCHGFGQHIDTGPARDVIEHLGKGDGLGNGLEMLVKAFLGRLVIIGRHLQGGIRAGLLGMPGQLNGLACAVSSCSGDDRNPFIDRLNCDVNNPVVLFNAQGGRFAGGAAGHNGARAVFDLELYQLRDRPPRLLSLS